MYNNQGNGFGPMMDNSMYNQPQINTGINPPTVPRYGDIQSMMNYSNMNNQRRQPTYLPGRMIQAENEVMAYEVPNDGSIAAFIQKDLQTVYLKTVCGDGLIHTNEYKLVSTEAPTEEKPNPFDLIMERLDKLEESLKTSQSYITSVNYERKPKYQEKKPYNKSNNERQEVTNE